LKFGKTSSVWVARNPPGFAFVEYEDARDAEDAVKGLDDKMIGNQNVKVEFAKSKGKSAAPPGGGGDHGRYAGNGGSGPRAPPRPGRHRAILKNLPQSFGWKELKDEMRRIGDVIYADVDANGDGVVEFGSYNDLEYAVRKLDGAKLDGSIISVFRDGDGGGRGRGDAAGGWGGPPPPPPPPPQRHSDRPYDRRDDRRDKFDDRDRDARDRHDERNRRDRDYDDRRDSRPPPGRHYDERPPPPRGDHGRRDDQDYRGRGRNDRHYD